MSRDNIAKIASKHLGEAGNYKNFDKITPELLVAIPREQSREEAGITITNYQGYDVWNAHEFSVLRADGYPVVATLKLVYDCTSRYIVESKSLKLYLHSFNFARCGTTTNKAITIACKIIERDLSDLLETSVGVKGFVDSTNPTRAAVNQNKFRSLDKIVERGKHAEIQQNLKRDRSILKVTGTETQQEQYLMTHSMRSNCRVTHQPDWASVFIKSKGYNYIDEVALLNYIISMRSEDHFHEEACELLFNDIYKVAKPTELSIVCLYTRRGGIDINPVRYIGADIANKKFSLYNVNQANYYRQ